MSQKIDYDESEQEHRENEGSFWSRQEPKRKKKKKSSADFYFGGNTDWY